VGFPHDEMSYLTGRTLRIYVSHQQDIPPGSIYSTLLTNYDVIGTGKYNEISRVFEIDVEKFTFGPVSIDVSSINPRKHIYIGALSFDDIYIEALNAGGFKTSYYHLLSVPMGKFEWSFQRITKDFLEDAKKDAQRNNTIKVGPGPEPYMMALLDRIFGATPLSSAIINTMALPQALHVDFLKFMRVMGLGHNNDGVGGGGGGGKTVPVSVPVPTRKMSRERINNGRRSNEEMLENIVAEIAETAGVIPIPKSEQDKLEEGRHRELTAMEKDPYKKARVVAVADVEKQRQAHIADLDDDESFLWRVPFPDVSDADKKTKKENEDAYNRSKRAYEVKQRADREAKKPKFAK